VLYIGEGCEEMDVGGVIASISTYIRQATEAEADAADGTCLRLGWYRAGRFFVMFDWVHDGTRWWWVEQGWRVWVAWV